MFSNADFWPAIWLTIGAAMVVTAALCLLVATYSPDWFRSRRARPPAPLRTEGRVTPDKP
jgi:hypothetical protein